MRTSLKITTALAFSTSALFLSQFISRPANAAEYSTAYKTDLKIYDESSRTEKALTLALEGEGAKHVYLSLAEAERYHRGLYLKNSADGKVLCQRGEDAAKIEEYFCELSLQR